MRRTIKLKKREKERQKIEMNNKIQKRGNN